MKINKLLTPYNFTNCNNTGRIKYLIVHYVGATGGAKANCQYYASQYVGASAHYYIGFDGEIWQSVEDSDIAWSVGASSYIHPYARNSNTLNFEMCVKKKSTVSMNATDKDWYHNQKTYNSTVQLVAEKMKQYNIPIENLLMHYHVTGKYCNAVFLNENTGMTWDVFKRDVQKILSGGTFTPVAEDIYRVRKTWKDEKSQLGAFTNIENAKKACIQGYFVFDKNGKVIYKNDSITSGTQYFDFNGLSENDAAKKILELAKEDYLKTGVLASITAAQMILESGYVTTVLSRANNCFGMKCMLSGNTWENSTWDRKSKVNIKTAEQDKNGNTYYIYADFRKYSCIEDSIGDHSAYLLGAKNGNKLRYAGLTDCKNYRDAITLIKNGGYATDVKYVDKICSIIERFGLDKYDGLYKKPNEGKPSDSQKPEVSNLYRVGTSWKNGKCQNQTNAYTILKNAKAEADRQSKAKKCAYFVFDSSGKAIYKAKYKKSEFEPYNVRVVVPDLRIRSDANGDDSSIIYDDNGNEVVTGIGVFGIVEEKKNGNYTYGKLLSGTGWIALVDEYVKKV